MSNGIFKRTEYKRINTRKRAYNEWGRDNMIRAVVELVSKYLYKVF